LKWREDTLYKAGTVKEMERIRQDAPNLPEEVYRETLRIVTMLDEVYGADRDVDQSDGGLVLIAVSKQDLRLIEQRYMKLNENRHEGVTLVKCENGPYINVFFLCNNEYGINVFLPVSVAPHILLEELNDNRNVDKNEGE
jgi:hypothetical protein